jgi:hypothetical protein
MGLLMLPKLTPLPKTLPSSIVAVLSLCVVGHFFAVGAHVLAARSGPWLVPNFFTPSMAEGPTFATMIDQTTYRYYLQPLGMTGDFSYTSDRVDQPDVYFEARLRNEHGEVVKKLRFPSPEDSVWLRQCYSLLAEGLGGDAPVPVQQMVQIPAPGQESPRIKVWNPPVPMEKKLVLLETEQHKVKSLMKDPSMQLSKPREWTLLLARSYARHLCRQEKVASVELVRYSRDPIMPVVLLMPGDRMPAGTFDTLESQFEVYHREN